MKKNAWKFLIPATLLFISTSAFAFNVSPISLTEEQFNTSNSIDIEDIPPGDWVDFYYADGSYSNTNTSGATEFFDNGGVWPGGFPIHLILAADDGTGNSDLCTDIPLSYSDCIASSTAYLGQDIEIDLAYSLTYTSDANGSITGSSTQVVVSGTDGTSVTATPNSGYHFVNWSDSSTNNPRTDTNISGDISVNANFEADAAVPAVNPPSGGGGGNGSPVINGLWGGMFALGGGTSVSEIIATTSLIASTSIAALPASSTIIISKSPTTKVAIIKKKILVAKANTANKKNAIQTKNNNLVASAAEANPNLPIVAAAINAISKAWFAISSFFSK